MDLKPQKQLAATILGIGKSRVWMSPNHIDEISLAIRREDIRKLIHEGKIMAKPETGISRGRARLVHKKKQKGLRRKRGSRKGKKYSVVSRKERWILRIRAIRKHLNHLRLQKVIDPHVYRRLYVLSKGGVFASSRQVDSYIELHNLSRK
ncbi:MAG: 50S ribosomal protein L19e [Candidatus Ranarchaeia archaeon]